MPLEFNASGFRYRQLSRCGQAVLLAKRHRDFPRVFYEVVVVVRRQARVLGGRDIPAHEGLPSSEQWGERGWSYPDEAAARRRFEALKRRHD